MVYQGSRGVQERFLLPVFLVSVFAKWNQHQIFWYSDSAKGAGAEKQWNNFVYHQTASADGQRSSYST